MQKKVEVTITPLGEVKVEAFGFQGQGCEAATKAIEQNLAGEGGVERTHKPEWNSSSAQQNQSVRNW